MSATRNSVPRMSATERTLVPYNSQPIAVLKTAEMWNDNRTTLRAALVDDDNVLGAKTEVEDDVVTVEKSHDTVVNVQS